MFRSRFRNSDVLERRWGARNNCKQERAPPALAPAILLHFAKRLELYLSNTYLFFKGRSQLNPPLFTPPEYYINATIDKFRAFLSPEDALNIKGVIERELIDVGQGVKMSVPLKVGRDLLTG